MNNPNNSRASKEDEKVTFDHLPTILSSLQKDVSELKNYLISRGDKGLSDSDEWMDVKALRAYHPDQPAARTVYDWIHLRRIPYHKDGKKIRFKRSEIDDWLVKGYHRTDEELLDDAIAYVNTHSIR